MSVESAADAEDATLEDFKRAGARYGQTADSRQVVLDEIETLKGELAYWTRRADVAWQWLMISDARLSDARDRLRAELRAVAAADETAAPAMASAPTKEQT